MEQQKKVAFHTLGCKLNFSESSTLAREFENGGYARAEKDDIADIHIINTCSVTDNSDKKCRNIIRKVIKDNPEAIVVVTGCYAQLKAEEIAAIEGVDIVVGNNRKGDILSLCMDLVKKGKSKIFSCETDQLTSFFSAFSSGDRTRTFLKVQDGCSYNCSYCTIPLARGASRNISINDLLSQANQVAAKGAKEIVLTGVNIGDFGRSTGEKFIDLLHALNSVSGIERYRISSIEPNLLTDEVLEFCATSTKFQPHFHIPIQSGSDKILKLMRRRYTCKIFADKINHIKTLIPDVFIGIDVIVGFPGETDADFEDCYNFLKEIAPAYLHIFPYSERADTPAIDFPCKVSPQDKELRAKRLAALCEELHLNFCKRHIGKTAKVLVESTKKGNLMFGHTENYIKVELPYHKEYINQIINVKITDIASEERVKAEII
ncbi:MAG: tRNA (N(6)-L-threonylcarbamoyladenosine(37)-C(2))-methylthiotransferase MtaB [Rikenellaceae bacterium]